MIKRQTVFATKKIVKRLVFAKNNSNSSECHDLEICVVHNDVEVVSEACHWLSNKLVAFIDNFKAAVQVSSIIVTI